MGFRQGSELALIPKLMYLPRVQANTQIKSESLETDVPSKEMEKLSLQEPKQSTSKGKRKKKP